MSTLNQQPLQRSQEWHSQRKGKITGSAVGAALGINPYMTPDALIRRMVRDYHNAESEFLGNIATEYGTLNEPTAILDYINKTGNVIDEVGFLVHPQYQWLGASPDGIATNSHHQCFVLEVKCPFSLRNDTRPNFKSASLQPHYYAQMQIEMACAQLDKAHFYQWNKYGDSLEIVPFNQQWFDDAVVKLKAFYDKYLTELNSPVHLEPVIQQIDSTEAQKLLAEYDALLETIDNASQRKSEIIEELAKLSDNKSSVICGRKFTLVKKEGAISYAKAIKDLCPDADLSKYQGKPSQYWKLT